MVVIVISSIHIACSCVLQSTVGSFVHICIRIYTQPGAWKTVKRSLAIFSSECILSAGGTGGSAFDCSRLGACI